MRRARNRADPDLRSAQALDEVGAKSVIASWAMRISNWDFHITTDIVWNWGDPVIGVERTYICRNIRKGVIWSNTQGY